MPKAAANRAGRIPGRRQRGITIIETLSAIAIGSLALIGLSSMIDNSVEDVEGQQAAFQLTQVADAAHKYISMKYGTLRGTTQNAVVPITIDDLKSEKLLPGAFSTTNAYLQRTCVLVRQERDSSNVPNGVLTALVLTTGGEKIPDRNIAMVAASAGANGGYISKTNLDAVQGAAFENAQESLVPYRNVACDASGAAVLSGTDDDSGHLVSRVFFNGNLTSSFLYREEVPGNPALNTMDAPLRLGSNAVVAPGSSCTDYDRALAVDTRGRLVSCVADSSGVKTWTTSGEFWKDPVDTFAQLNDAAILNAALDGEVRVVRNLDRAFTFDGSTSTWVALAVDENGNLGVPGNLAVLNDLDVWQGSLDVRQGSIHAGDHITSDRNITAAWNLRAQRDVIAEQNMNATGNIAAQGNIDAQGNIIAQGNVEAVRDVNAGLNMHAQRTVSGGWYVRGPGLILDGVPFAGDICHIETTDDNGNIAYINPIGTVMRDGTAQRLLICDETKHFIYVDAR